MFSVISDARAAMVSLRYLASFSYNMYKVSVIGHGVVAASVLKPMWVTFSFDGPCTVFV